MSGSGASGAATGRRVALLVVGLLAGLAGVAAAHLVPVGVGSQSELRLTPRRIHLNYNLGFSAILGLAELRTMDADRSGSIDALEQEAYLDRLGQQAVAELRLTVDGKRVPLVVRARRGLGIMGPIEQVQFDTWFELEAPVELGPGPHVVTYYEGRFEGQTAEQLLWLPLDRRDDLAALETRQDRPLGAPIEERGSRRLLGRDVTIEFAFTPEALARDAQLARIEPWLTGLERTGATLADGIAGATASELDALAFRGVRFGGAARAVGISGGAGAALAQDRVLDADSGQTLTTPAAGQGAGQGPGFQATGASDSERMIDAYKQPFSLLLLAIFFGWGMTHALMPGHGKTMVAAYLLGTRGRVADALKLGGIVTFTHVFALYTAGVAIVWVVEAYGSAQGQAFHERLTRHVTLLSGLGLVIYGVSLATLRARGVRAGVGHEHGHGHGHEHDHGHGHGHDHGHEHDHGHGHEHVHSDGTRHAHPHGHGHGEGHEHDHAHGHEHTHADGTTHAHPHDHDQAVAASAGHPGHAHEHVHADGTRHSHGHGHGHEHDHAHGHEHVHADGTRHSHPHGHGGDSHEHAHDEADAAAHPDHAHEHVHADGTKHSHGHGHAHEHAHDHGHEHVHADGTRHSHPHDHAGEAHDHGHAEPAHAVAASAGHGHGHGHGHEDHAHEHVHADGTKHSHGHGHAHEHDHSHGHEHVHADGTRHSHPHGHGGDSHEHAHGTAEEAAHPEHVHEHVHADGTKHSHGHGHGHEHDHSHGHEHVHADGTTHAHPHDHAGDAHDHAHGDHAHGHGGHTHSHGGHAHSHGGHAHSHGGHAHSHGGHAHSHGDHAHSHGGHAHSHGGHTHSHGGHGHAHDHANMTEEEHSRAHAVEAAGVSSWKDLLVLGVTGGLVPCPAGVTLVFYSLTLKDQNTKKLLVYLTAFSLGLGSVLVAIALAMVITGAYLRHTGAAAGKERPAWLDKVPVFTAGLIAVIGVGMCYEAFDPGYAQLKSLFAPR